MRWRLVCITIAILAWMASSLRTAEPDEVRRLVRQLDDSRFERREQADLALRRLGPEIVELLEAELQANPPLEVTHRLHNVLHAVGQTWRIDRRLEGLWRADGVEPPPSCDDLTFLRRATLDLVGRVPTLAEIRAFEKDQGRRKALIDRLLASDEHADHWARLLARRLLGEFDTPSFPALHRWLKDELIRKTSWKDLTVKLLTASGTPKENPAVLFLAAHLGQPVPGQARGREGLTDMMPLTGRTVWSFLGVQLHCAQCHDHAFNPDWKQKHFWSVNAFFRQIERTERDGSFELRDNAALNPTGLIYYQSPNGRCFPTPGALQFLDGRKITPGLEAGRRRPELARFVTSHPFFGQAMVHRAWRHLFGPGLTSQPLLDDIGEHNEAFDQDLVDTLAKDVAEAGYDHRQLLRWIMASRAYQARSSADPTVWLEGPAGRRPAKPLSFDQLFDSVTLLTGGPSDQRASQRRLAAPGEPGPGDPSEVDLDPPEYDRARLALWLMNGQPPATGGVLTAEILSQKPDAIIESLFLATLTRRPAPQELAAIGKHVRAELAKSAEPLPVWQDVLWALINGSEFRVVR